MSRNKLQAVGLREALDWSIKEAIRELTIASDTLNHGDLPKLTHMTSAFRHLARATDIIVITARSEANV